MPFIHINLAYFESNSNVNFEVTLKVDTTVLTKKPRGSKKNRKKLETTALSEIKTRKGLIIKTVK